MEEMLTNITFGVDKRKYTQKSKRSRTEKPRSWKKYQFKKKRRIATVEQFKRDSAKIAQRNKLDTDGKIAGGLSTTTDRSSKSAIESPQKEKITQPQGSQSCQDDHNVNENDRNEKATTKKEEEENNKKTLASDKKKPSENKINKIVPTSLKKSKHKLTKCLGIDCEMVGFGAGGRHSQLARVSIVNSHGDCLLDKYVRPIQEVTDYRTKHSGIRPLDLMQKGEDYDLVRKEVLSLIRGRILVGHAIFNDFKVLCYAHPQRLVRDTANYRPFKELLGTKHPSLKKLAEAVLEVGIQEGEHDSVEDARTALKLYTSHRKEWESALMEAYLKRQKKSIKGSKKVKH